MPAATYRTDRDVTLAKPLLTRDTQGVVTHDIVSSGPAFLLELLGVNNSGSTRYIMFFDSPTLPAPGAVPKLCPIPVAANQSFTFTPPGGPLLFTTGIVWASSSTFATLTITGAADVWATAATV